MPPRSRKGAVTPTPPGAGLELPVVLDGKVWGRIRVELYTPDGELIGGESDHE